MAINEDFYGWNGGLEVVAEGILVMGIDDAFSGGPRGDREAEDDGFRCFPVTYCWWRADSLKWDAGSSAEELEVRWEEV